MLPLRAASFFYWGKLYFDNFSGWSRYLDVVEARIWGIFFWERLFSFLVSGYVMLISDRLGAIGVSCGSKKGVVESGRTPPGK